MPATRDDLTVLNVDIGVREEAGDVAFFHHLLAPVFAMRRARDHDPFTDRLGFINGVRPSPARHTDDVRKLFESDRCAVVTCVVLMTSADASEEKRYRNVRVFTRADADQPWSLLAWANEPMPEPGKEADRT